MSEITHTPVPWRRCGGATPHFMAIHSQDGYVVFGMADGFYDKEHGQAIQTPDLHTQGANTEFIVRACNFHDALLAACKGALRHLEAICDTERDPDFIRLVNAIDEAERPLAATPKKPNETE